MIQLDELHIEINKLQPKIKSLEEALKISDSKKRLETLELETGNPDFWDNSESSRKILA